MKLYYIQNGIGKAKYLVNHYDGQKQHPDGSQFWDISILRNKKDLAKCVKNLIENGYREKSALGPPPVEILVFRPCDLHPSNTVEIWRNGQPSGSCTSFPSSYPWEKVLREARDLAQDYSDPQTGTPAPCWLATMTVYRNGDDIRGRVVRTERL